MSRRPADAPEVLLRDALDGLAQGLDAGIASRLNQARQRALALAPGQPARSPATGWVLAGVAAALLLGVGLLPRLSAPPAPSPEEAMLAGEAPWLLDSETPEFYAFVDERLARR